MTDGRPRAPLRVASVLVLAVVLSVAAVATGSAVGTDHGGEPAVETDPAHASPADGPLVRSAAEDPLVRPSPAETGSTGAVRENATLAGTVYEPDGDPADGARVVAVNTSVDAHRPVGDPEERTGSAVPGSDGLETELVGDPPLPSGVYTTETGAGGEYSLSLPPGEYTLWAYGNEDDAIGGWYSSEFQRVTLSPGERHRESLNGTSLPSVPPRLPDYRIRIGETTGQPGETVAVPFSASVVEAFAPEAPANLTGGRVTVTFDPSVADVASVEGVAGQVTDRRIDDENGTLEFAVEGVDPAREATLANVTFRVTANESTVTHLVLDSPTTLATTDGTVSLTDDAPRILPDKGAITVVPGDVPAPVERADRDGDGTVSTPELAEAIRDWVSGEYTTGELAQVIRAWAGRG